MLFEGPLYAIEDAAFLDKPAVGAQTLVERVFAGERGRALKALLHGRDWFGHELHPVLTDLPIGAWSLALIFDALETTRPDLGPAADLALRIGIVGALGAAVTGLVDWSGTKGKARRVGAVHAVVNSTALALYAASAFTRSSDRPRGKLFALAGYGLLGAGAYLGGHLAFGMGPAGEAKDFVN